MFFGEFGIRLISTDRPVVPLDPEGPFGLEGFLF